MDKTKLWYINANKIFTGLPEKDKREIESKLTEISAAIHGEERQLSNKGFPG